MFYAKSFKQIIRTTRRDQVDGSVTTPTHNDVGTPTCAYKQTFRLKHRHTATLNSVQWHRQKWKIQIMMWHAATNLPVNQKNKPLKIKNRTKCIHSKEDYKSWACVRGHDRILIWRVTSVCETLQYCQFIAKYKSMYIFM